MELDELELLELLMLDELELLELLELNELELLELDEATLLELDELLDEVSPPPPQAAIIDVSNANGTNNRFALIAMLLSLC